MHPSPSPVVPARPVVPAGTAVKAGTAVPAGGRIRTRALRAYRLAVPVLVTGSLIASAAVVVSAAPAAAAGAPGTYTIGGAPVPLNQASDPGIGVLAPTADAAENGMFGPQLDWPLVPLHAALTRNGEVVSYGTPTGQSAQLGFNFDKWNPASGAHTTAPTMHGYDSFCNALVTLDNGTLLMVSGNSYTASMLVDPVTLAHDMGPELNYYRWYTTALRLTDDRILLLGGANPGDTGYNASPERRSGIAVTPEIGTGTGAWGQLPGATSEVLFGNEDGRWWYPRAFNGPNGGVVGMTGNLVYSLDPTGQGSVQQLGVLPFNPRTSGSQVMYEPGKVLVAGGGSAGPADEIAGNADAAIVDFNGGGATITSIAPMANQRTWVNLTVLPTGEVLANGGTRYGTAAGDANAVKQSEIWNPASGQWRAAATAQRTRTYHSTSLPLPSGAILTAGGGAAVYTGSAPNQYGPENNLNAEVYYPSYLFAKAADGTVGWASRPAIDSIAGSATHGGALTLGMLDARGITGASLISMPSVTHSQNTDQRRIPLNVDQNGATVTVGLPASVNAMPPGDYQLTVLDAQGVPSTAQVITIRLGAPGQVTVAPDAGYVPGAGVPPVVDQGGVGTAPGAGQPTGPQAPGEAPLTSARLKVGSTIGLESAAIANGRLTHGTTKATASKITVKKVTKRSSPAARKASSWIVRRGLGSKSGYSFESVDRKGYYLVAPADGTGALRLVKRSKSASFAKRATFSPVDGVMGHDRSFRLTARPTQYVRVSGAKGVVGKVGTSAAKQMAATFEVPKGLSSRK